MRRRLLPVYDDTDDALAAGRKDIKRAAKSIKDARSVLHDTPSSFLLDGSEPLTEIDGSVERADRYAREAQRYLKSYERFIDYDEKRVEIYRKTVAERPIDDLSADVALEELRAAVDQELGYVEGIRQEQLDLDPHPDAEQLHDVAVEGATTSVDYYEDFRTAIDNLSVAQIEQADDDLLSASKRVNDQESRALAEFAADSELQLEGRKLEDRADKLVEEIAGLGTGDGKDEPGDHFRDPAPEPPKRPASKEGDRSVS